MAAEEENEDAGDENIFYVSQKALLLVKLKLQNGEAIDEQFLQKLSFPGNFPDEEIVVPIDLRGLDKEFPNDDLIDEDMHLDVGRMVEKLGVKGAAKAFVKAQETFLANADNEPADERPRPMTAKEWQENWDEDDAEEGEEEGEEGEEEGFEDGEEEYDDGNGPDEQGDEAEPMVKRPKNT